MPDMPTGTLTFLFTDIESSGDPREYWSADARAHVDQRTWDAAWTAGRAMPLAQAILFVLEPPR